LFQTATSLSEPYLLDSTLRTRRVVQLRLAQTRLVRIVAEATEQRLVQMLSNMGQVRAQRLLHLCLIVRGPARRGGLARRLGLGSHC
jgi:hypothetical protein